MVPLPFDGFLIQREQTLILQMGNRGSRAHPIEYYPLEEHNQFVQGR